ncbi:MAG: hypothetical protein E6G06_20850 [Actinobacteria bacterium]|nr:MAG: hypothetical protein E6G06_20850 [Actinomycetota bacterium]
MVRMPFVILLALTFVAANAAAMLRARPAAGAAEPEPALEWVGITSPWTPERVAAIDHALALDQVRVRAPT